MSRVRERQVYNARARTMQLHLLLNGSKILHCDEKFINSCSEYTKWRKMFCNTSEANTKN